MQRPILELSPLRLLQERTPSTVYLSQSSTVQIIWTGEGMQFIFDNSSFSLVRSISGEQLFEGSFEDNAPHSASMIVNSGIAEYAISCIPGMGSQHKLAMMAHSVAQSSSM